MIDLLENATAFETIITLNQAERLIISTIPKLLQTFGSSCGRPLIKGDRKRKTNSMTVRSVIQEVYD